MTAPPGARPPTSERVLLAATLTALGLLSAVFGVVGAFLSPALPHVVGVPVPVGVLFAVAGNFLLGFVAARAARTRMAPVVTTVVWVLVALLLGSSRPEGDLIVTGSSLGLAFLLLGTTGAAAAIALSPGRRAGFTRTGQPPMRGE